MKTPLAELKSDVSTLKHVLKLEEEKEKNYVKRLAEAHSDLIKAVEQRDLALQQVEKAYREGFQDRNAFVNKEFENECFEHSCAKRVAEGLE